MGETCEVRDRASTMTKNQTVPRSQLSLLMFRNWLFLTLGFIIANPTALETVFVAKIESLRLDVLSNHPCAPVLP
jgi:7-cyano-7-deazaguanine synthase in queuosine biosynthesis